MTKAELIKVTEARISRGGRGFDKPCTEEVKLQNKVIYALREVYKDDIWFAKISDRYNSGIPDIVGCIHGRFFAFELKDNIGKPSTVQRVVIQRIKDAGGNVWVVRTVKEALIHMITILKTLE